MGIYAGKGLRSTLTDDILQSVMDAMRPSLRAEDHAIALVSGVYAISGYLWGGQLALFGSFFSIFKTGPHPFLFWFSPLYVLKKLKFNSCTHIMHTDV
eukprot:m.187967 g.187967  ORF g.187967 m.187967 type:complete len:98 (+) comp15614_c0_seq34:601-894(+)